MAIEVPKGLLLLDVMILDTLLDDVQDLDGILSDLNNSEHYLYLECAKVASFAEREVKEGLRRLLLGSYLKPLDDTGDALERREPEEADFGRLREYWFELTPKGRELALSYEWNKQSGRTNG